MRILLIDDDESFFNGVRLALRGHPLDVTWAANASDGIREFKARHNGFATVILDYKLPDMNGNEVMRVLRKINPEQDVIFASGHSNPEYLMELLEAGGARSFIRKGRPVDEMRAMILDSIAIYERKSRIIGEDDYSPTKAELDLRSIGFIGRSLPMHSVHESIRRYIESPYPVLIAGETGVGKELVARALTPPGKTLVTINCPRYVQSEHLMESELFGYVKGAFTGANHDQPGLVTQAHGNVLFLDELHELSFASQAKLLRFLQEMKFRRVGDHNGREAAVSFRLISATKPDIVERVHARRFLGDLYHRVAQLVIQIPPLRERPADIEPLVRHFQDEFNEQSPHKRQVRISTVAAMARHSWPGNVRELQSAVRQMLTDATSDIVNPVDFERYLARIGSGAPKVSGLPLEEAMRSYEENQLKAALKSCRTKTEAAIKLGLKLPTLIKKLERLGIDSESYLT